VRVRFGNGETPGFINETEIPPHEGERNDFGPGDGRIQYESRHKCFGRCGLRFGKVATDPKERNENFDEDEVD
jgi:hypothetical protein